MTHGSKFSISSGRAMLAAERAGTGRSLVCLHAGVADRRMYAAQVTGLRDHVEIISYDRRGYGQTQTPDESFSHRDDLSSVVDQLDMEKPILLGCSQGGRIAIDFTLAHPDRVGALILISTALSGAPAAPVPEAVKPLADALEAAEDADDIDRINAIEAHIWLDGPTSEEGRVQGPLRDLFLDMNSIALRHPELSHLRQPPSAYDRLSELALPVLLMHGTLDFDDIVARHAHLARTVADARSVPCEGNAHLPPMENPSFVNSQILSFCRDKRLI